MLAQVNIRDQVAAARPTRLIKAASALRAANADREQALAELRQATTNLADVEAGVYKGARASVAYAGFASVEDVRERRDQAIARLTAADAKIPPARQEYEAALAAFVPRFRDVARPQLERAGDLVAEAQRVLDEADGILSAVETEAQRFGMSPRTRIQVDQFARAGALRVIRALGRELR